MRRDARSFLLAWPVTGADQSVQFVDLQLVLAGAGGELYMPLHIFSADSALAMKSARRPKGSTACCWGPRGVAPPNLIRDANVHHETRPATKGDDRLFQLYRGPSWLCGRCPRADVKSNSSRK